MKTCGECGESKSYDEFHRDAQTADSVAFYCKPCKRARNMKTYYKNPSAYRARWIRNAYGITMDDYEALFLQQGGVCAICKTDPQRTLAVDHDHLTGRVRGLLCANCNRAVGLLKDSAENARALVTYLENVNAHS